jgi:hypothetical protein
MANDENTIRNLKLWFEQALTWLHADGSQEALQRPHRKLLGLMEEAGNKNQPNLVWEYITELEELIAQTPSTLEYGEIFIRCSKMAVALENLKDGLRLCLAAESKYQSYRHQRAVSLWMSGCIYWINRQRINAIKNWQQTITLFTELNDNRRIEDTKIQWYENIIPRLERCLELAIDKDELPPFEEDVASAQPEPDVQRPVNDSLDVLKWLSIVVTDSVSATGFGPVEGESAKHGYLEVAEVLIGGELHKVHSIKRKSLWKNIVSVKPSERYGIILVVGPSMNDAKPIAIDNGDYVLVRLTPNAEDNDIVIAGAYEFDERATVKRFRKTGNKFQLLAESLDPFIKNHPDATKGFDIKEINIIGIVEAVFKKRQ